MVKNGNHTKKSVSNVIFLLPRSTNQAKTYVITILILHACAQFQKSLLLFQLIKRPLPFSTTTKVTQRSSDQTERQTSLFIVC